MRQTTITFDPRCELFDAHTYIFSLMEFPPVWVSSKIKSICHRWIMMIYIYLPLGILWLAKDSWALYYNHYPYISINNVNVLAILSSLFSLYAASSIKPFYSRPQVPHVCILEVASLFFEFTDSIWICFGGNVFIPWSWLYWKFIACQTQCIQHQYIISADSSQ